MELFYQYLAIFFNFFNDLKSSLSTTRLVVHEFDNGKVRLERVKGTILQLYKLSIGC